MNSRVVLIVAAAMAGAAGRLARHIERPNAAAEVPDEVRRKQAGVVSAAHLDWAEKAGIEHLRGRLATGDLLLSQANTLLSILLVGMAGALSYGAKVFAADPGALEYGAAVVAMWFACVAWLLTWKCIATRDTQTLFNEPGKLYRPELGIPMDEMRAFELENLQVRIDLTKKRNHAVARWLDGCRYATAATPIIFAVSAGLARAVSVGP